MIWSVRRRRRTPAASCWWIWKTTRRHPVRSAETQQSSTFRQSWPPQRVDTLLRPKVDAALNLHELTLGMQLTAFVMFLVPVTARRRRSAATKAAGSGGLPRRLAALPEPQWEATVLDLVLDRVATVLGFRSAEDFGASSTFLDLGLDSLAAVELRNGLSAVTGLRSPATLVFGHPTLVELARFLLGGAKSRSLSVLPPPEEES
jgi:acyl carrier protein